MTPSPLRLLDWPIPLVQHRYTRRDTALYALSLGVGAQALDGRQLVLVDPWHEDLKALPALALVLGYPGFWLGEPAVQEATGVHPWQVLHGEQSVQLTGPLPVEGAVFGETRVTAIVDKGSERGSVLHSTRKVFRQSTGDLIATCRQSHFLRNAGGFGSAGQAPASMPSAHCGDSAPRHTVDTLTLPQQALWYRLNGDANPVHLDADVAARAGFSRPILHGMCSVGIAVTAVIGALADFDPHCVRGFSVRMTSPVLPGDTLRTEIWADGSFTMRALERGIVVLKNGWTDLAGVLEPGRPREGGTACSN